MRYTRDNNSLYIIYPVNTFRAMRSEISGGRGDFRLATLASCFLDAIRIGDFLFWRYISLLVVLPYWSVRCKYYEAHEGRRLST